MGGQRRFLCLIEQFRTRTKNDIQHVGDLLVIVGLSTGGLSRLPRAGAWMLVVKKVFALVMLGAAEYYLVKMGQLII